MPVKDLTGRVSGRLTVLSFAGKCKAGRAMWKCKCSCGNTTFIRGGHISGTRVKSCGCLLRDHGKWLAEQAKERREALADAEMSR